jgi:S1-C subfamily serine protease
LNGHIGLIHAILPATADIQVTVPDNHPSTRTLGSERGGSGTLVDPDGYILTVHYVTVGAAAITVTLSDGEQYPGALAAQDQETGLALVKIPARGLPFLRPAPLDSITLGQPAVIIASSGQAGRRVSGGYVSSMECYDGHWEYMLEKTLRLTAPNPGFGGGTLANFKGEIIGVVSLNLTEIAKFSLAIPIDYYLQYAQELKQHGQVRSRPRRPWFGFYPQPLAGHVVVGGLVAGGPAERYGLREGDIIVGVENTEIHSRQELYQEMWRKRPGERISLRVLRDEQSLDLEIVAGDRTERYRS